MMRRRGGEGEDKKRGEIGLFINNRIICNLNAS
jgi:hypothetical protein